MTPGHDAASSTSRGAGYSGEPEAGTERLGPRPPRIEPPAGVHRSGPVTGQFPSVRPEPPTGGFAPPLPANPHPAAQRPTSPHPTTGGFATVPPGPVAPAGHARARRSGSVIAPLALGLAVLLLVVTIIQTMLLLDTRRDLAATRQRADTDRVAAQEREAGLEARTKELERQAGNTLDAAAVAGDVLPSVFRVVTNAGTGSAFAFGAEASGGGTNLLTNFHVVESVWNGGGRSVVLEQKNRRFNAQVVKVDSGADLALLTVTDAFPRLQPAAEPARPGQPVVVVGAPLGLDDSVTSGVISALRNSSAGPVLQFDAPVNPGNSGGPVVNAQKQVVGVVNAKIDKAEGVGLGIPVAVVCKNFGLC